MYVSKRLNEMFDREAVALQQNNCDAMNDSAGEMQKLFVATRVVVDRSMRFIVRHSNFRETVRLVFCSAYSAIHE